ncbi:hypothetical protein KI387_000400, partial [Taxus chinensis]
GFRSFAWMAVSYQLKDELNLSPSASQFLVSIAFFPWSVKPLYGILSDCLPIQGRKRLPYLIIASILSLVPWIFLGVVKSMRNSYISLTIFLTFQNLGSAMADVVIDAMVAEAAREERAAFAGDLQSLSWLAMAVGGIAGSLIGGYALSNLRIDTIFLLFSLFPTVQLFACSLVEEKPSRSLKTAEEQEVPDMPKSRLEEPEEKAYTGESESSRQINTNGLGEQVLRDDEDWVRIQKKQTGEIVEESNERAQDDISMKEEKSISEDKHSLLDIHKVDGMRRRKDPHLVEGDKKFSEIELKLVDDKDNKEKRWLLSVKSTISTLFQAMRRPVILRPMLWFFLAQVTIPNISTVMFYYQTDFLHLDASFLGAARVVGWGGLMLGTFIYNHYLKHVPLRKIFLGTHIALSFLTVLDVILVLRINILLGISDRAFVLCTSALADAVNQF